MVLGWRLPHIACWSNTPTHSLGSNFVGMGHYRAIVPSGHGRHRQDAPPPGLNSAAAFGYQCSRLAHVDPEPPVRSAARNLPLTCCTLVLDIPVPAYGLLSFAELTRAASCI